MSYLQAKPAAFAFLPCGAPYRLCADITSDGVVVGVVIRRVERYDLVKIKPTESEAEHWFCLCLRCLRSSENCIVGVASRSGRINQWQCSISDFAIGWFFRFCFRLRFRRACDSASDSDFWFSLGQKLSYDSDYDSDSDSVASENQPLGFIFCSAFELILWHVRHSDPTYACTV